MEYFSKSDLKILKLLILYRLIDLVDSNEDNELNTETLFYLYVKLDNMVWGVWYGFKFFKWFNKPIQYVTCF